MLRAMGWWLLVVVTLVGCKSHRDEQEHQTTQANVESPLTASSVTPALDVAGTIAVPPDEVHGDVTRGRELIARFECTRCHDIPDYEAAPRSRHCAHCHDAISKGAFPAPASALARWKRTTDPYTQLPSLDHVHQRFTSEWLFRFLRSPVDLRPHLDQSMPRLELSEEQARDIVAALTDGGPEGATLPDGNAAKGRELIEQRGCGSCHEFSGVPPLSIRPDSARADERLKRSIRLAPDLRWTRERFQKASIVRWLMDPVAMKKDTLMPSHGLSRQQAIDVAAYLYTAELGSIEHSPVAERLPVLTRKVTFQEVEEKVLGVTCRHCHSNPDASLGDGGPGNSGGFGFSPKGLDLSTYRGVSAGYLDGNGTRQSVFLPISDGTPRLLAVLLARQKEEAVGGYGEVRGMPLGFPALTAEQVQLVESWIAQGRPR